MSGSVQPTIPNPNDYSDDFVSKFLQDSNNVNGILGLMNSHFVNSLDYLYGSKFYGSQSSERPGMAKALLEESDRHWEEGMNVLKKYLHLGGTTYENFVSNMVITRNNDLFDEDATSKDQYKSTLKSLMVKSREIGNKITNLYHEANHKISGHGDADVAHFLQEKAEEESAVARKMVGHYLNFQKIASTPVAFHTFDKNL